MKDAALSALVKYSDRLLRTDAITDYDGAVNGLQVENSGGVTRIAAAVDASLATIHKAIALRANLLVVHHGLFWSKRHPWTGKNFELLRLLIENDVAIYSSHLPLDMHPTLGNNAQLCAALGLRHTKPFFRTKDQFLGLQSAMTMKRDELVRRVTRAVGGEVKLIPGGPTTCRRIGVVTGGAGAEVKLAAAEGVVVIRIPKV